MQAAVRWLVAVAGSVVAFLVVAVPWAVLSDGSDDPWDVIGPVGGVFAAGVLAALSWWAAQATTVGSVPTRRVRQSARGRGTIKQTAGNQGAAVSAQPLLEDIRQKARGSGDIDQIGGNRS
ncbi:hypothetical protein ACIQVT_09500 [Streptomyces sp. NPDC100445]|uniref:hypothetical protein n=1 Tax=Streptomyces sp. NPDC100445 TaxID=3366102 RepID=UPI00382AC04C